MQVSCPWQMQSFGIINSLWQFVAKVVVKLQYMPFEHSTMLGLKRFLKIVRLERKKTEIITKF